MAFSSQIQRTPPEQLHRRKPIAIFTSIHELFVRLSTKTESRSKWCTTTRKNSPQTLALAMGGTCIIFGIPRYQLSRFVDLLLELKTGPFCAWVQKTAEPTDMPFGGRWCSKICIYAVFTSQKSAFYHKTSAHSESCSYHAIRKWVRIRLGFTLIFC